MDVVPLIFSLVIVFLLVVGLVYLIFYLPKKQENLLKQFNSNINLGRMIFKSKCETRTF